MNTLHSNSPNPPRRAVLPRGRPALFRSQTTARAGGDGGIIPIPNSRVETPKYLAGGAGHDAAFSRYAGFFASLKQVEDRLAAEQPQQQREPPSPPPPRQSDPPMLFSDTMTASPLFLATSTATAANRGGESSGLALDFLTLTKNDERARERTEGASDDDDDGEGGEDIARLMALLGLSTLRGVDDDSGCGGGCDCSGGEGFLAKVVGVVGPKCDQEKKRVDSWIEHYRGNSGGCREPARLAHLLLAKASWCWDGEGHGRGDEAAIAFPSTVKEFLERDAPPRSTEEGKAE